MNARIQKWSNSLAVRVPKAFADEIGLEENSSVEVHIEDGKIILTLQSTPTYSLEDLLERVSNEIYMVKSTSNKFATGAL